METRYFLLTDDSKTPDATRQEIKKVLDAQDKDSLKTLTYYIYNPSSSKKTISVASYRAINKIAYLQPKLILNVLKSLAQNIFDKTPKAIPKNDLFAEFRNIVAEIGKLKEDFTANNIAVLNKFYGSCQYIINNPKDHDLKNKPGYEALLKEIMNWIDGLYLQLSIKKDRRTIEKYLNDNSAAKLKLIDNPIAGGTTKKLPTKEKEVIELLKRMPRTQSNPILNDIFIEIFRKTEYLPPINMALEVLYQTAETLSKSYPEQQDYFVSKMHEVLPQLAVFKEKMKSFPINEDTQYLAKEIALFFEAGFLSAGDITGYLSDKYMRYATSGVKGGPLDRIKIATIFLEIAQALRLAIDQFEQQKLLKASQPLLQPPSAPQPELQPQPSLSLSENQKKEEVEIPPIVNKNPIVLEENKPELTESKNMSKENSKEVIPEVNQNEISLPTSDLQPISTETKEETIIQKETKQELTKEQVVSTVVAASPPTQKIITETKSDIVEQVEYKFWLRLHEAENTQDEKNKDRIKLQAFANALIEYELSAEQISRLGHLKGEIDASIVDYLKKTYSRIILQYIPYLGEKLENLFKYFGLFQRYNHDIAKKLLQKVRDFYEKDPRAVLLALIEASPQLFFDRQSNHLGPSVKDFLLNAFEHLHNMGVQKYLATTPPITVIYSNPTLFNNAVRVVDLSTITVSPSIPMRQTP